MRLKQIAEIAAAMLLAVGMGGSAWAGVTPTQSSQMYYSLLMTPLSSGPNYASVAGVVGVFPGLYGDGDYKCYVSGTIPYYPGTAVTSEYISLAFAAKNATTGQCPDYAKFGPMTLELNWPQSNSQPPPIEDWELGVFAGQPIPRGEMFWVQLFAGNGANQYIETAVPTQAAQPLPEDFQAFALLPSSINPLQLYGSAQVYLAPGLANTIGF